MSAPRSVSDIDIFDHVEQGSPEWIELHRGLMTTSDIAILLREGRTKGSRSITRDEYVDRKAAERYGAEIAETYSNGHMERGKLLEKSARADYAFITGEQPELVGFIRNNALFAGTSPDALICGRRGGLEIKTKLPGLQVKVLRSDQVPPEHVPQIQGQMLVGELEFVDFVSYWPGLPLFIKRVDRDESYLRILRDEIERFNAEVAAALEEIRSYGELLAA